MVHITSYHGIGDTIYQRPVVAELLKKYEGNVSIETPWPDLFWDLEEQGLKFHKPPHCRLRTQSENMELVPRRKWTCQKPSKTQIRVYYDNRHFARGLNPLSAFEMTGGVSMNGSGFRMPLKDQWLADAHLRIEKEGLLGERIALIRQPSIRSEWPNQSRNPDPRAFRAAVDYVRDTHTTIGIGYLDKDKEWLDGEPIETDLDWTHGEVPLTTILALLVQVDVTIAPVGFLLPAACAVGARAFFVFGGCNSPSQIFDDRMLAAAPGVFWAAPYPFCDCLRMDHDCHKAIPKRVIRGRLERLIHG